LSILVYKLDVKGSRWVGRYWYCLR